MRDWGRGQENDSPLGGMHPWPCIWTGLLMTMWCQPLPTFHSRQAFEVRLNSYSKSHPGCLLLVYFPRYCAGSFQSQSERGPDLGDHSGTVAPGVIRKRKFCARWSNAMYAWVVCDACMGGVWCMRGWDVMHAVGGMWCMHGRCVMHAWAVCGACMGGVQCMHEWRTPCFPVYCILCPTPHPHTVSSHITRVNVLNTEQHNWQWQCVIRHIFDHSLRGDATCGGHPNWSTEVFAT